MAVALSTTFCASAKDAWAALAAEAADCAVEAAVDATVAADTATSLAD